MYPFCHDFTSNWGKLISLRSGVASKMYMCEEGSYWLEIDYQCNSAVACKRICVYALRRWASLVRGIHDRKYDSLHGHSREFRSSCTCVTNNKQWPAAEIACPTCATLRQPLPSLMQKDRRLSIWHVARRFPCTTDSLLADFFLCFFLRCFDQSWTCIGINFLLQVMILVCIKNNDNI